MNTRIKSFPTYEQFKLMAPSERNYSMYEMYHVAIEQRQEIIDLLAVLASPPVTVPKDREAIRQRQEIIDLLAVMASPLATVPEVKPEVTSKPVLSWCSHMGIAYQDACRARDMISAIKTVPAKYFIDGHRSTVMRILQRVADDFDRSEGREAADDIGDEDDIPQDTAPVTGRWAGRPRK
jgi:hypothetical protein